VIPYSTSRRRKGVREVLAHGNVAGYPMQDVRVIVYDGKHHPVDSKEVAFVAAGARPPGCLAKARPIVLEPIVNVQIVCPDSNMATSRATCRRGAGRSPNRQPGGRIDGRLGTVPLSELDGMPAG